MNNRRYFRTGAIRRATVFTLAGLALVLFAGCHYSLLNRSSSLAAWSPDGTQLAVCIDNDDSGNSELWLVDPEKDSTTRLLTAAASSSGPPHLLAPRWSADGKRLYCARTADGEDSERRPAVIVAIDLSSGRADDAGSFHYAGSRGSLFAEGDVFAPLADGTLVARDLGTDRSWQLVRIDPASGTTKAFAETRGGWMTISGSPAGDMLAVAVPGSGGSAAEITVFRANGEPLPHRFHLWEAQGDGIQPSLNWSPAGDRLAVVLEDVPPDGSRWRLPADGGLPDEEAEDFATLLLLEPLTGRTITVAHDVFGLPPVFSPDGGSLAYAASSGIRDGDGELLLEVRVHGPDGHGGGEYSLPGLALPLAWSADSAALAYYLGRPDNDNQGSIIRVAADGSGTTVINSHQQDRLAVASQAGDRLAWVSGDGAVQVLDTGSGRLLFNRGLTTTGTIQAAEDDWRQGRPRAALDLLDGLRLSDLGGETAARRAAVSHAALHALGRPADAAGLLDSACSELALTADPAASLLFLCGALSDHGFRPEAERLVEQQLLDRYPDSPQAIEALWALAALKQSEGDSLAALGYLRRLLGEYPAERHEVTRAVLLAALAESGENPQLVEELSQWIIDARAGGSDDETATSRAAALYALGRALEHQGRVDEAGESFAAALGEPATAVLPDGRDVAGLCRQALFRLAGSGEPAFPH